MPRTAKVTDLREGDRVDLEGDPFADPRRDNIIAEYEYVEVAGIEQETPGCVRVDFYDYDSVGFPTNHRLRLAPPREVAK